MTFVALINLVALALAPTTVEPSNTPEGRTALASFAGCIARSSPEKVHDALTRDFRTPEYRRELQVLTKINHDCLRDWEGLQRYRRITLRAGGLPFAAALAESMLKRSEVPLNVRLLRAARIETPTYAPSDRIAMCIARSDADNVAALLNAPIDSETETEAARALNPALRACSQGTSIVLEPYGLRAILATASYRLLAAQES